MLRKRYADRKPVRMFYEISTEPLYTIGGKQIISRMLELCGGRNIFNDLTVPAAPVSLEAVLACDPHAIVTGDDAGISARLKEWQRWPQISAVKINRLFSFPGDLLARVTPRVVTRGRQLCKDLNLVRNHALGSAMIH